MVLCKGGDYMTKIMREEIIIDACNRIQYGTNYYSCLALENAECSILKKPKIEGESIGYLVYDYADFLELDDYLDRIWFDIYEDIKEFRLTALLLFLETGWKSEL